MNGEHAQTRRRPSRTGANRRRRPALAAALPSPRALAARGATALRRGLPSLVVFGLVGAAGAGTWLAYRWVLTSPRFAIDTIEVRGNVHASKDALAARLAGARGHNLFRLDLAALEADVGREPWVAEATVRRELPGTLVVEVAEHLAAAVVELGGLYLADAKGTLFARARSERDDLSGLPVVTGLDRAAANRDPAAAAARVVFALEVAAAWAAGDRPAAGEVHLDDHRGVTLHTREPAIAVQLGEGDAPTVAGRMAAFDAAWGALDADERARTTSIHLGPAASPARVTVAFAEPAASGRPDPER